MSLDQEDMISASGFTESSCIVVLLGSSRNPGFEHIPEVCHIVTTHCTLSLSTTQKYVVEE